MDTTVPPPPPAFEPPQTPPPPSGSPPEPPVSRSGLPFEDPSQPLLDALVETIQLLVTRPREAYATMQPEGDITRALLYAVLLGWIGLIAGQLYNLVFRGAMMRMMATQFHGIQFAGTLGMAIGFIVVGPIFILMGLFIWTALVHLALMLIGGANRGFVATFKAVAFAQTSAIAQVVPFCGGFIGAIWGLVLQTFGIAAAHDTTDGKAAAAVLLPLVFCCACGLLMVVVFGAGIAGLAGLANHG